jgi:hypothetical protein
MNGFGLFYAAANPTATADAPDDQPSTVYSLAHLTLA